MGEIGVAVVVPEGRAPTLVELREFAATHLAGHELPEQLVTVDALPLTAGDKVDRAALARRVAELS
jgi:non-ribosomal peptide synthetase component E (peptide arylation enzyme)